MANHKRKNTGCSLCRGTGCSRCCPDIEAEELRQEIIDMMREEQEEIAFAEKWNAEVDHGKA